jgi:hypothetical protein
MADIRNANYTMILSKQHCKNMFSKALKVWTFRSYETWIPRTSSSICSLDRRFEILYEINICWGRKLRDILGWCIELIEDINIVTCGSERNLKVVESYFATGYRAMHTEIQDQTLQTRCYNLFRRAQYMHQQGFFPFLQPVVWHPLILTTHLYRNYNLNRA